MQAGQRGLCGRQQKRRRVAVPAIPQEVDVIDAEAGKLSRIEATPVAQQVGRQDQLEAVGQVRVDEVVQQRPLQARPPSAVHPESVPRQLGATLVID